MSLESNAIYRLQRRVKDLEEETIRIIRKGYTDGGGSSFSIRTYTTFPAIPASPTIIYLGAQLWAAGPDNTVWAPLWGFTTKTGVVGTT